MLTDRTSTLSRSLPRTTFELLRNLWQQMAELVGEGGLVLTENILSSAIPSEQRVGCFTLLVSQQFSGLLTADSGTQTRIPSELGINSPDRPAYQLNAFIKVGLTFDPETIAAFLNQLVSCLANHPQALETLERGRSLLQPNDPAIQSEFTLSLLEILAQEGHNSELEPAYPYVSVCQPVENALRQQVEQERLLNQVTTQIRQSLELPIILETAVEQVRYFLQVDRLAIYQFEETQRQTALDLEILEANRQLSAPDSVLDRGRITYESRASEDILSVLNFTQENECFFACLSSFQEQYCQGLTQAVADTETAYILWPYLLECMRQIQVRAKLIVPIVVQQELWGLLIAHQCFQPRQWENSEKNFLRHIAEHLAIAITQAQLYAQLQQQKQTLEQRVADRTQALHDALLAAQAASLAKSEFLATMSHELRTPLTCVIGLSSTLLRLSGNLIGNGQLPVKKQRDYLQTIHDSGQRLLDLINDILDLSQVEAGKAVLNISEFSLANLVKQTLQLFADKARIREVTLHFDLQQRVNLESLQLGSQLINLALFRADLNRVRQILFNLISNAIKFTPPGGQVNLRLWQEDNTAVLQVEDTGIGIPEHQLPLLFQKFQQLESSYNRTYEGTGLGLALTKQLVELHGGRIEVESTLGDGSTFTVWLPGQPSVKGRMKNAQKDSSLQKGSVVLVEDDEEAATLICEILTTAGYQLVWLIDGFTAAGKIELLQPHAVIVNMRSSGVDGREISRAIRRSPTTQHIKILILEEIKTPEDRNSWMATGANDYLPKPVQPDQLLDKVAALVTTQE